jgi:aromatase
VVPIPTTVDNTVVISAPFDTVWAMTNDVEHWPDLFSEYASVEILERGAGSVRFRLTTVPDADGAVWSWVSERTPDPATRTVRAHRVETGPFEHMDITWTYRETPAGVELRWRQDFTVKPGLPFGDEQMRARLDGSTKVQMAHVKARVEQAAHAGTSS